MVNQNAFRYMALGSMTRICVFLENSSFSPFKTKHRKTWDLTQLRGHYNL